MKASLIFFFRNVLKSLSLKEFQTRDCLVKVCFYDIAEVRENFVGKLAIAVSLHFLLFKQCFSKAFSHCRKPWLAAFSPFRTMRFDPLPHHAAF